MIFYVPMFLCGGTVEAEGATNTKFLLIIFAAPNKVGRISMVFLTRLEHFNAAHKLYNPEWSREENDAVFGKCANDNWHGHNYELYVTVKGEPEANTGFLIDVKKLGSIIREYVTEKLDHKNLNMDVDFLQGQMCSTENLTVAIWEQLESRLPQHVKLHSIKLYETPRIYVEYFGPPTKEWT